MEDEQAAEEASNKKLRYWRDLAMIGNALLEWVWRPVFNPLFLFILGILFFVIQCSVQRTTEERLKQCFKVCAQEQAYVRDYEISTGNCFCTKEK